MRARSFLPYLAFLAMAGCGGGTTVDSTDTPVMPTPSAFPTWPPTPTPSPESTTTPAPNGTPTPPPSQGLECYGPMVRGVDVSDSQGGINWAEVKASGIGFATMKASQGNYFEASSFRANWAYARELGIIRGAYHFFDPNVDGVSQARLFLAVVGPLEPDDLPPELDIECPDGDSQCLGWAGGTGDQPSSVIAQGAADWLNTVQVATGRMPIIYTFGSYFSDNGVNAGGYSPAGLWIADWGVSCPSVPYPWRSARFWQFADNGSVPGIGGSVDLDVYFGTFAELTQYALSGGS